MYKQIINKEAIWDIVHNIEIVVIEGWTDRVQEVGKINKPYKIYNQQQRNIIDKIPTMTLNHIRELSKLPDNKWLIEYIKEYNHKIKELNQDIIIPTTKTNKIDKRSYTTTNNNNNTNINDKLKDKLLNMQWDKDIERPANKPSPNQYNSYLPGGKKTIAFNKREDKVLIGTMAIMHINPSAILKDNKDIHSETNNISKSMIPLQVEVLINERLIHKNIFTEHIRLNPQEEYMTTIIQQLRNNNPVTHIIKELDNINKETKKDIIIYVQDLQTTSGITIIKAIADVLIHQNDQDTISSPEIVKNNNKIYQIKWNNITFRDYELTTTTNPVNINKNPTTGNKIDIITQDMIKQYEFYTKPNLWLYKTKELMKYLIRSTKYMNNILEGNLHKDKLKVMLYNIESQIKWAQKYNVWSPKCLTASAIAQKILLNAYYKPKDPQNIDEYIGNLNNTPRKEAICRLAFMGGHNEMYSYGDQEDYNVSAIDINSAYPWALTQCLPTGPGYTMKPDKITYDKEGLIDNIYGIIMAEVYIKRDTKYPRLYTRDIVQERNSPLKAKTGHITGVWTTIELNYAISTGTTKITNIIEIIAFKPTIILDQFAKDMYLLKNLHKTDKTSTNYTQPKLVMNSGGFGKFAQQSNRTQVRIMNNNQAEIAMKYGATQTNILNKYTQLIEFDNISQQDIRAYEKTKSFIDNIKGNNTIKGDTNTRELIDQMINKAKPAKHDKTAPQVSAFISAYTRVKIHQAITEMTKVGIKVHYSDTDSIFFTDKENKLNTIKTINFNSNELGDYSPVYKEKCKMIIIALKQYILKFPNNKIVRKIKGISEINMLKLTFEQAMNLILKDKNSIIVEDELYIKSNIKKLTNDEMTRRYTIQSMNNKRILEIKAIKDNQAVIDEWIKENEEYDYTSDEMPPAQAEIEDYRQWIISDSKPIYSRSYQDRLSYVESIKKTIYNYGEIYSEDNTTSSHTNEMIQSILTNKRIPINITKKYYDKIYDILRKHIIIDTNKPITLLNKSIEALYLSNKLTNKDYQDKTNDMNQIINGISYINTTLETIIMKEDTDITNIQNNYITDIKEIRLKSRKIPEANKIIRDLLQVSQDVYNADHIHSITNIKTTISIKPQYKIIPKTTIDNYIKTLVINTILANIMQDINNNYKTIEAWQQILSIIIKAMDKDININTNKKTIEKIYKDWEINNNKSSFKEINITPIIYDDQIVNKDTKYKVLINTQNKNNFYAIINEWFNKEERTTKQIKTLTNDSILNTMNTIMETQEYTIDNVRWIQSLLLEKNPEIYKDQIKTINYNEIQPITKAQKEREKTIKQEDKQLSNNLIEINEAYINQMIKKIRDKDKDNIKDKPSNNPITYNKKLLEEIERINNEIKTNDNRQVSIQAILRLTKTMVENIKTNEIRPEKTNETITNETITNKEPKSTKQPAYKRGPYNKPNKPTDPTIKKPTYTRGRYNKNMKDIGKRQYTTNITNCWYQNTDMKKWNNMPNKIGIRNYTNKRKLLKQIKNLYQIRIGERINFFERRYNYIMRNILTVRKYDNNTISINIRDGTIFTEYLCKKIEQYIKTINTVINMEYNIVDSYDNRYVTIYIIWAQNPSNNNDYNKIMNDLKRENIQDIQQDKWIQYRIKIKNTDDQNNTKELWQNLLPKIEWISNIIGEENIGNRDKDDMEPMDMPPIEDEEAKESTELPPIEDEDDIEPMEMPSLEEERQWMIKHSETIEDKIINKNFKK